MNGGNSNGASGRDDLADVTGMARAISCYSGHAIWILLILSAATGVFAQPNSDTVPNFPNLATIRSQAAAGSAAAQAKLGDYHMARGDTTNAFFWYRVAAENGDPQAQISLATCYLQGKGTAVNIQESVKWQRMASIQRSNKPTIGRLADQVVPVTRTAAGRIQTLPPVEAHIEAANPGTLQKPFEQTLARSQLTRITNLSPGEGELEDIQLKPRLAD